jgi:hypothetical protein
MTAANIGKSNKQAIAQHNTKIVGVGTNCFSKVTKTAKTKTKYIKNRSLQKNLN